MLLDMGIANSVMVPVGVIRPILFPSLSVNQRLWSGPVVIAEGLLLDVGTGNAVRVPAARVPLLVPAELVLPPVPQAVRRSTRSPGMTIRTNLRANGEEIRIKDTPFT
jgi:hypothetical protein